ncbi:MAG: hypothetical protein IKD77_03100 [Bacilli bacterium]|nr:hypothetical protein [Bacilli bacterium]
MKIYRLMEIEEFIKMSNGMEMKSEYGKFTKAKTNSEGFCFIGENVTVNHIDGEVETVSYKEAIENIFGIMSDFNGRILVEFEVADNSEIKERLWRIYLC